MWDYKFRRHWNYSICWRFCKTNRTWCATEALIRSSTGNTTTIFSCFRIATHYICFCISKLRFREHCPILVRYAQKKLLLSHLDCSLKTFVFGGSDFLNVDLNSKTVHDVSHVAEWSSQRDRFALGHLALGTIDRVEKFVSPTDYLV